MSTQKNKQPTHTTTVPAPMDNRVIAYFDDLQRDTRVYDIVAMLRRLVLNKNPSLTERIMYGGLSFHDAQEIRGGIYVYSKYVSLVFSEGYTLQDVYGVLAGKGKYRRHITIYTMADISEKHVETYIKSYY